LGRMHITNLYDTSIDVNVLNNAYRRIFIDPKTVAVFHDKYDMPTGIFVEQCRGEWIGVPCLGYNVLAIDQESQNYVLVEDETGFVYWIKNSGQEAYLKYLLIDEPMGTLNKYSQAFQKLSSRSNTIQFMIDYLGVEIRTNQPNNLTKIKELGKESGFFGFDILSVLHTFLLNFGFNHAGLVGLYAFIGWVVLHRFRFIEYFPLAISMLCCSLGLFFLTFFGDGMEIRRHVFPSFVLLTLGGTLYLLSWLRISFFIAKSGLAFACTRLASLRSASG